jgi:hypothetical protein
VEDVSNECAVCMDGQRTHCMVPCGHRCLCATCAVETWTVCPLCSQTVQFVMKVYS